VCRSCRYICLSVLTIFFNRIMLHHTTLDPLAELTYQSPNQCGTECFPLCYYPTAVHTAHIQPFQVPGTWDMYSSFPPITTEIYQRYYTLDLSYDRWTQAFPSGKIEFLEPDPGDHWGVTQPFNVNGRSSGVQTDTSSAIVQRDRRNRGQIYRCCICADKDFAWRYSYEQHMLSHGGTRPRKNICQEPDCTTAFTRASDLKRHVREVHLGLRPFTCSRCPGKFTRQRSLQM
jgi:hypothetical protein